jgi:hypothetical protein
MHIVALIGDRAVIERILRHLGLWTALRSFSEGGDQGVRVSFASRSCLPAGALAASPP